MKELLNFFKRQQTSHAPSELKQCLEILQIKFPPEKVIIVAGTNGKGSVCVTLHTLLRASGKNVGLFTSPHILKINERIRFNESDISDDDFCRIFRIVHEKLGHLNLSGFEYLTMMAAFYFYYEHPVDYVILEVGLGGTLDATNVFDHDISVITKLGLDHESILGKGIKSIAKNKLGIVQNHNKVFHLPFPDEVLPIAEEVEKKFHADFVAVQSYDYFVKKKKYPSYFIQVDHVNFKLGLLGVRAVENTSLAIAVFQYLEPNYQQFLDKLQDVVWPCRLEVISYKNREIFLSGDHNPQGIFSLLEILQHFTFNEVHFVVGACFDKNHRSMIQILSLFHKSHIYLTETPQKTLSVTDYSDESRKLSDFISNQVVEALDKAVQQAKNNDIIIVTGSLYLTGYIKQFILDYSHNSANELN